VKNLKNYFPLESDVLGFKLENQEHLPLLLISQEICNFYRE